MKAGNAALMIATLLTTLACSGCKILDPTPKPPEPPAVPQTVAADRQGPSYEYRPLDPLKAKVERPKEAPLVPASNCRILEMLPDETVRLAIGHVKASGGVSYGVARIGVAGERYVAILDYLKSDTLTVPEIKEVKEGDRPPPPTSETPIPTYVGVGLRMTANFAVTEGSVDLGNLIAIGAAAQAKQIVGTLVVQSLGLSGKNVLLPIPSDISPASIQQALVAIGTIKSKIYDADTQISPRVVGTYDVFQDTKAFDEYFSQVLRKPPTVYLRVNSNLCKP